MTARRIGALIAIALLATGLGACGKKAKDKETLKAAIARTATVAHKFVYVDQTPTRKTSVSGLVEDSYRYKAQLSVNNVAIEEEAVSDDSIAVRSLDPPTLGSLLTPEAAATVAPTADAATAGATPAAPTSTTAGAQATLTALANGQWVVDKVGAPSLAIRPDDKRKQGDDPIFDSLTALEYTARAVDAAEYVKKYDPDSLEPVYKATEDPFPKPKKGARTERWDLKEQPLPKPDTIGATGGQVVPSIVNFRKMAIYIQDGLVVEVREVIDVEHKLPDLIRDYKIPGNTTAQQAVDALNKVRTGQGNEAIRLRSMVLDLRDLGKDNTVDMPSEAVDGTLSVVKYRGKAARVATSTGPSATGT